MLINEYTYEVKKSKFIAYYYKLDDENKVDDIISSLKREHKKARHVVYAYKINNKAKKYEDKEPANTAATPIYNVIEKNDLNNVLIVIVRYFGGIKLGASPLFRAYSSTAANVIKV